MDTLQIPQQINAANRLDRLPITRFHRIMVAAVAFAYFYEFADINSFSITAARVRQIWTTVTIAQVSYVTAVSFVGMFIGAVIAGGLADRYGRKRVLVISTLEYAIFSLIGAFSWNIAALGTFRVLTSAGLAAMTVVAAVYINEMFPKASRGKYQALAIVIGICGTPATNFIASAVISLNPWSWRLVYVWGALGIFFVFFIVHLKESPRWFVGRGRFAEAEAVLTEIEQRVERESGQPLPPAAPPVVEVAQPKATLKTLLQKKYLFPTILLSVLWITQTIGFFGYSSWAPTLLSAQGVSVQKATIYVALSTIGAPLGSWIASLVTDRFERKWSLVVFGLIIAVSGLLYGLTLNPIMIVAFGFCVNMFERGYTALGYAYSPELYDTYARSLGTSFSYGIGRLSNAFAPLLIAALYTGSGAGYKHVFFFIAGTWAVGAIVLAIFGPATRRLRLEQEAQEQAALAAA